MTKLFLLSLVLSACTSTDAPPECTAENPSAACEAACKTGDPATEQVCPGADVLTCIAECEACAPDIAWCPR